MRRVVLVLVLAGLSAVPAKPYLDLADFPQLKPLRDNWQVIRDEAMALTMLAMAQGFYVARAR